MVIKCKSIYGNNKDFGTNCCVRFFIKGIYMFIILSFYKIFGAKSTKRKIEKVYNKDKILLL